MTPQLKKLTVSLKRSSGFSFKEVTITLDDSKTLVLHIDRAGVTRVFDSGGIDINAQDARFYAWLRTVVWIANPIAIKPASLSREARMLFR